jgi:hypothetical protein
MKMELDAKDSDALAHLCGPRSLPRFPWLPAQLDGIIERCQPRHTPATGRLPGTGLTLDVTTHAARALLFSALALAAREIGAQLLAAQYGASRVEAVTIPYDGGNDWPLLRVGQLVLIERWGGVRDTVMSTELRGEINRGEVRVSQTARLGASAGGTYARLRRLTSTTTRRQLATVATSHPDGTNRASTRDSPAQMPPHL